MSHFSVEKTILPFDTLSEMYHKSDFRLALTPKASYEDDFKYSTDPLWQKIYKERIEPYLQEYDEFRKNLSHLILKDSKTVLYKPYSAIR